MSLWRALGAAAPPDGLHAELKSRYAEAHRQYHTAQHLAECLASLDRVRTQLLRPAEVELALWFHDAIYDPRRHDSELRSADWARRCCGEAGLAADVGDRVHALVMMTRHDALPDDPDGQALVDIDLAILGAAPSRFAEYERQVRAEYAWVPEPVYRRERRKLLQSFLDRPAIYSTAAFRAREEARARTHLAAAIAALSETAP